jgi:nonsense-mediated mRNA decay protein 3
MFCVECGKETKIYKDGSCVECYIKTHTFTKGPKTIDLPVCNHCGSYKYKNTWLSELLPDVIKKLVKKNFKISKELNKIDINSDCKETNQGLVCKIYISGFIDNTEITEEHDLLIHLKRTVCDICSKQFGGYHESIVQIRTDKRKLTKEELQDIEITVINLIENLQAKGNRALFITDMKIEHGGLDFYLSDKNTGLIVAKKLQEQYGGKIKQSAKNIGMKDSKQIYRVTYLIRLPSFKKHDFIKLKNSFYYIESIHGNKIKIMNLKNWEITNTDIKEIQKAKVIGGQDLVRERILVSQTKDEVQIMDDKTYKTKIIKKPKPIEFNSEKIKTIKINDNFFLFSK